jgi:hypothetical protein
MSEDEIKEFVRRGRPGRYRAAVVGIVIGLLCWWLFQRS